jgi:hypothetical protein
MVESGKKEVHETLIGLFSVKSDAMTHPPRRFAMYVMMLSGVCLGGLAPWAGCRPGSERRSVTPTVHSEPAAVQADSPPETTLPFAAAATPAGGDNSPSPAVIEGGNAVASPDHQEIDALIREAAGPMADSVNSSLARLDTNLGRKEHTLVIMALKSETRRWYFLTHMTSIIDRQQLRDATDIIDSYAPVYQELLDRRTHILETEHDGRRVEQLLNYNKVAAIKLTMEVRRRILREVLTADQRKQYNAQFNPGENPPPETTPPAPDGNRGP